MLKLLVKFGIKITVFLKARLTHVGVVQSEHLWQCSIIYCETGRRTWLRMVEKHCFAENLLNFVKDVVAFLRPVDMLSFATRLGMKWSKNCNYSGKKMMVVVYHPEEML